MYKLNTILSVLFSIILGCAPHSFAMDLSLSDEDLSPQNGGARASTRQPVALFEEDRMDEIKAQIVSTHQTNGSGDAADPAVF